MNKMTVCEECVAALYTSDDQVWEYFGREGVEGKVVELYRVPIDEADRFQRFGKKQRLRKGCIWQDAGDDPGLLNDYVTGWFSIEDNKLSVDEVVVLIEDWASRKEWPGRP